MTTFQYATGIAAVAISFAVLGLSAGGPSASASNVVELKPSTVFNIRSSTSQDILSQVKIREMKAVPSGLLFLVQSPTAFSLILTDKAGSAVRVLAPNLGPHVEGLAATDAGAAVIVRSSQASPVLRELSLTGNIISETPLSCYTGSGILSINQRPSTICPDGTISQIRPDRTVTRFNSWLRAGALAESFPGPKLAIIDQTTLQVLINDLQTNRVSTVSAQVPEFQEALRRIELVMASAPKQAAGAPPLGKQLLAMATAADSTSFFVLVYPYDSKTGPFVVRLDSNGNVVGRYKCLLPRPDLSNVHKITVQNGDLILATVGGDVLRYRLLQ